MNKNAYHLQLITWFLFLLCNFYWVCVCVYVDVILSKNFPSKKNQKRNVYIELKEKSQFGCSISCFLSTETRTKMNIKCFRSQGDFLLIRSLITGLKNIFYHRVTSLILLLSYNIIYILLFPFSFIPNLTCSHQYFLVCIETALTGWITVNILRQSKIRNVDANTSIGFFSFHFFLLSLMLFLFL